MSTRRPQELLNSQRIRHLRHVRGFSVRRVARHLGISATAVTSLEAAANHAGLPLRVVTDLAHLLGVAPAELFARDGWQPAAPTTDDQAVEAALAITRSATSTTDLGRALGWDLARVRSAIELLGQRQAQTGTRIHDHGWQRHALRPATEHLSEDQQRALHRIGPQHRGLTIETASLLAQVAQGTVKKGWHRRSSTGQRMALQTLLNQGLVVIERDGAAAISQTVRLGFFPESAAATPSSPSAGRHGPTH